MSSPYVPHPGDYPDRHVASSPANSTMNALDLQEPSIRPMRLKVLYSFDAEEKTKCLARWPEILNIRTAHLDESTQIGVIELKTCIQAIVTASPEIMPQADRDFTVYAYDYSEYDTPQVGQGMLSRVLASSSPTPSAPAHESDTIVTGRVCKSMLGLFANGIQETLEVKLRLVPVPTSLQNEYNASMKNQRETHHGIPEGVDPEAWNKFIKANPGMMSMVSHSRSGSRSGSRSHSPALSFGQPQHGIEHVQKLLSEGYRPQSVRPQSAHYAGSVASGRASNRSTSPTPSLQSMPASQPSHAFARPMSRVSNDHSHSLGRRMSVNIPTELTYEEERTDDGPARKRAKVMKADHPGKNRLGKLDTLRATASSAASIRVLQPTAVRPGADAIRSLEAPPRVPTPTPPVGGGGRRPALHTTKSGLGREWSMTSDSGYRSLGSEEVAVYSESAATSPDNVPFQSDYNSPEDSASSPPVIRPQSAVPTSPMLPTMPHQETSFQHSDIDDLFGETTDAMELPWNEQQFHQSQFLTPEFSLHPPSTAPPAPQVPFEPEVSAAQAEVDEATAKEAKRLEISQRNARRAIGFKRSQTWSGEADAPRPASAPAKRPRQGSMSKAEAEAKGMPTTKWNKEKRKAAMQSRLKESIAQGQMPPFCENCGAIETPTWRKAFSRIYSGDHSHLKTSNDEGGIICIQIQETNEDGSTKLFKIFKKSLSPDDEAFSDVLLCNPCGIWLSNHKYMRPETHWAKKKGSKGKKGDNKKTQDDNDTDGYDAANAFSEAGALASEPPMQFPFGGDAATAGEDSGDAQHPPLRQTVSMPAAAATSPGAEINSAAFAALERAIRSSPGRFLGSRKSPIEVDRTTPDTARRSLFPSPKSGGPLGVDIGEREKTPKKTKQPPKTPNEIRLASNDDDVADKENQPPPPIEIDDLDDLFSECLPNTPSRKRLMAGSPGALFKTPAPKHSPLRIALATGDFFSSAAKAFLHAPQTPGSKTQSPIRKSASSVELTPFTRHLNQLLSEPNLESPSRFLSELSQTYPAKGDTMPSMTDGGTPSKMFRSGDFDFSDFPSSDGPMPSSPPAWFGVYEDADNTEGNATGHDAHWGIEFDSSPDKAADMAKKDAPKSSAARVEKAAVTVTAVTVESTTATVAAVSV